MDIFEFLDKNNIKYNNKDLIKQAFIHSSYTNEHNTPFGDNERLEFMGDAVLQIYSAHRLYELKPELSEGVMSNKRASLVSEHALASFAYEFSLNDCLLLGAGEEKTGGRRKDSLVSDMFEAFIGAIYIDTDYYNAVKLLDVLMLKHIKENDESNFDYKTRLQEYVQADSRRVIEYRTINSYGPSNNPTFEVEVLVDNLVYGKGKGQSKKEAQKAAAKAALEKMAKI